MIYQIFEDDDYYLLNMAVYYGSAMDPTAVIDADIDIGFTINGVDNFLTLKIGNLYCRVSAKPAETHTF